QAFNGNFNWIIERRLDDGQRDNTFSGSGLASVDMGNKDQFGTLGAVTTAGILVVGQSFNGASFDGTLLRLKPDGFPDGTFGTSGLASTDLGDTDRYFAAVLDTSGRVVSGGQARATDDDLLITRHTPAGTPDPSFGTAGIVRIDRGPDENVRAIAILPDGRIVAAGYRDNAGETISVIALLDSAGTVLDVRDVDLGPGDDAIQDLQIDHHGRLVALGSVDDSVDPTITDFVIARFVVP
ncbi:MAG: hypothetical protein HOV81_41325, partial [Kofleriaceae bacterium]|nr:hypothetical protein [Kofleriaceae bacterium]